MRRSYWIVLIALSTSFGTLAIAHQKPAAPAKPAEAAALAAPAAVGYTTTASIQVLMLSIVDPTGDSLWDSVSVSITGAGSKETRPRTDAEWLAVRDKALLLAEAGNLLKIPGRRVGPVTPIRGIKPETRLRRFDAGAGRNSVENEQGAIQCLCSEAHRSGPWSR